MSFYQDYLKKEKVAKKDPSESPSLNNKAVNSNSSSPMSKEEEERKKFLKRVRGEVVPENDSLEPETFPGNTDQINAPLPPKPPESQKSWARLIVVLSLILGIGAVSFLWYWMFKGAPREVETIIETEIVEVEVPEVLAPASLIQYDYFKEGVITTENELRAYLSQYLSEETEDGKFTKLLLKNQRDKNDIRYVNLQDFLSSFKIKFPEFGGKINQASFNLFLYSQEQENRVGFAVEIMESEGLLGMMREWEPGASRELTQIITFLEKNPVPREEFFTSTVHRNERIWCQEYDDDNFEICYSLITTRFGVKPTMIFTTSLLGTKAVIDKL